MRKKRVLVKTYLFESGLFYLSESLKKFLESHDNVVGFIPKAKYEKNGPSYNRIYPKSVSDLGLKNRVYTFDKSKKIEDQVEAAIIDFNADVLISMETLMQTSAWISKVKHKTGVRIIDVPMMEWVTPSFLKNDSYNVFDRVWALTKSTQEIFEEHQYNNVRRISWDYADPGIFYPPKESRGLSPVVFYHQGSLNPHHSTKNTKLVIEGFRRFHKEFSPNAELIISGLKPNFSYEKHSNILVLDKPVGRKEIAELYRKSHCVVAPSTREGLGLSLYEAQKCGCKIITTDVDPLNVHQEAYLCGVETFRKDERLIPEAVISVDEIVRNLRQVYEDIMSEDKTKVTEVETPELSKSAEQVEKENQELAQALNESPKEKKVDPDVLAKLKAKAKTKPKEEPVQDVVFKQDVSINVSVIGVGQAGSRIAEEFNRLGYDVGVINTSEQDLKFIDVLDNQKLLLEGTLGGTGKDLDLGREIFAEHEEKIVKFVDRISEGNDMTYLAVSGGGGTGSSSVDTLVPMLYQGGPVGVIYVLPKQTEDAQSKSNSIETLARLAKMTANDMISSLVVVDNARIEQIYANLSQAQFWKTANLAIVEPLHLFNRLTAQASRYTSLDPSDFGKIISAGDCSVYGVVEVEDYLEETALAESVISSLNSNMLAEGFDLGQTRVGGVLIVGSKEALDQLPAINIDYCFHMVSEQTNGASIYQGIYELPELEGKDVIKIYSWFAGLGLPTDRIENLKKESQDQAAIAAQKAKGRMSAMTLDLEEDKVKSAADEIHRKIEKKKSGFNRLQRGGGGASTGGGRTSRIDKRRRK